MLHTVPLKLEACIMVNTYANKYFVLINLDHFVEMCVNSDIKGLSVAYFELVFVMIKT